MSTSTDGRNEKGAQIAVSSMYDSDSESQLDDGCDSENSFGSYFGDNAMDEELNSLPPAYSDEELNIVMVYVKSPSVDLAVPQYTPPTRSTQPAFNAKFSGPMCIVRGLIFNLKPALILVN